MDALPNGRQSTINYKLAIYISLIDCRGVCDIAELTKT